jgi:hypothetical protein
VSISSDSAEQTIRLTLEGMEVVAKISGVAVKNIAVALYTISQDKKKTKGKARLNSMLKSDNELKIFSIKKEDLKTFYREAKSYGILYCALINRRNKNIDGMVDIMVRAKDAPKVNRIVERYNLTTFDKASIQTEIEKEKANITKGKDLSENIPDVGEQRTKVNEAMVDDIFAKPDKEQNANQNPEVAKTEKSPPSEPSLKSKNNSEGVTKPVKKESVKKKLKDAEAELKVETELKKAQKSKENIIVEMPQQQTTQTPKLEITNKERGK